MGSSACKQGEEIPSLRPDELIGSRTGDPADLHICTGPSYVALPAGLSAYDFDSPERSVPAPPSVENGPFTELRLAPSPAAAVFALLARMRRASRRSIWQQLWDALKAAIYRVEAPGVRIRDCHSDGRLVGGLLALRKEGELARERLGLAAEGRERVAMGAAGVMENDWEDGSMSEEWTTLDDYFNEAIAAVELPDDSKPRSIKADWALVGSVPRLKAVANARILSMNYMGESRVRLRDLFLMRDVAGRRAGGRVSCFLVREMARDLFSVRNRTGFTDWLKLVTALLGALSGLGSFSWLLSQLISSLA